MKWFIYDNEQYYPYGEIVEAPSAEAAAQRVVDAWGANRGLIVFPLSAAAHVVEPFETPGVRCTEGTLFERITEELSD